MSIVTINPASGRALHTYETLTAGELDVANDRAASAGKTWSRLPVADRAAGLARLAAVLRERREHLAGLATSEMGTPLSDARAEIDKCAITCDFYAEHAEAFLRPACSSRATFALVQRLLAAKRDLRLAKELAMLDGYDAVILDDIGYVQQSRDEMEVLFTFLAERYERRSVVITSNVVFSEWDRIFKDPMTTAKRAHLRPASLESTAPATGAALRHPA